ncbi:MAG: hypothetical protein V3V35_07875 [Dehalococcoidia bacterium]
MDFWTSGTYWTLTLLGSFSFLLYKVTERSGNPLGDTGLQRSQAVSAFGGIIGIVGSVACWALLFPLVTWQAGLLSLIILPAVAFALLVMFKLVFGVFFSVAGD